MNKTQLKVAQYNNKKEIVTNIIHGTLFIALLGVVLFIWALMIV